MRSPRKLRSAAAAILAIAVTAVTLTAQSPRGTITHEWKPVRRGGSEVVAIEVRSEVRDLGDSAARAFSMRVPIMYAGVTGIAERTRNLDVRDADGVVPLTESDDPADPGGFPYYRHWRAGRAVRWPVVITYEALTPQTVLRGPPFGLYAAYGGVSGAPSGFLVLPDSRTDVTTHVHWNLSDLANGSAAATSFGDGDFTLRGPPDTVTEGWIMAGPVSRYPARADSSRFSAVWLGTPTFDPAKEMAWAERMYAWLGKSYGYLRPLPAYRVFVRVGWRGGTALGSSFMVGAMPRSPGANAEGESPRETIAHEMGHRFVGGIDAPQGVQSWFTEGLNTYYTRLLMMRGGFSSVDEYGSAVNAAFRDYWFGKARNWSADSIVKIGFNDEAVRHMPYVRGSLYFANVDAEIRARSHGRRTLDEVVRELFERRERGEPFNTNTWIETVTREAGPQARTEFEDLILKGTATLVPASDAFGPCLMRRATAPSDSGGVARPAAYEWVRVASVPDSTCRVWGESAIPAALVARKPAVARNAYLGTFGGKRMPFTATVEEQLLRDARGMPDASVVTIAYTREGVRNLARRPVTFVFNGGPGSSSSPLHMSGIGPRLTSGDSTIDNHDSILDATDLVFIDPVGTGFSRPFTTEIGRREYWTRSGDAASVAQVIRDWLRAHGRERSPKYLLGESYGTTRAALILRDDPDLRFNGVVLVAVVAGGGEDGGAADRDRGYVAEIPTLAASAYFHGAGSPGVRSALAAFERAAAFGDARYAQALGSAASLAEGERERVAGQLAPLVGVDSALIVSHDLRLTKDDWMLHVLAARELRTGMLDTRVTSKRDTTRTGGLNDPAFNGGQMHFGTAMLVPSMLPGDSAPPPPFPRAPVLERYLKLDLGFPTLESYRSLNLDINVVWDYESGIDAVAPLAAAMRRSPKLRLFWAGGLFDLTTPAHGVQVALARAGVPANRTTAAIVPAGHSVFADSATRRVLAQRLRAWIR